LSLGLDHELSIAAPLLAMHKEEVIRRGVELRVPLEHTLSCMNPVLDGDLPLHCGLCSKCRGRRDAFSAVGVADPAAYANQPPR
jgi:7-cyano-7-deazaguanine synthase